MRARWQLSQREKQESLKGILNVISASASSKCLPESHTFFMLSNLKLLEEFLTVILSNMKTNTRDTSN